MKPSKKSTGRGKKKSAPAKAAKPRARQTARPSAEKKRPKKAASPKAGPAAGAKPSAKRPAKDKGAPEGVRYEALAEGKVPPAAEGEAAPEVRIEEPAAEEQAVALRDPLSVYMREASRHPILAPEEEHELAVRWYEHGDQDAALKLVTSNLRLVVKIAWEYRSAQRYLLDLIQEGNIGLMMAVRNFDPYKGVRLPSYAQYWIRAYMLRYILNNFHLVKLGTTQAQRKLFFNLRKEKARLEREGFRPTPQLLAKNLGVKESEVEEMDMRLTAGEVSLSAPVGGEDGGKTTLEDFIADKAEAVDDVVAGEEQMARFRKALAEFRATLEERDAFIFDKRMIAETPLTLEEVGEKFGVSKERARQLEARIKDNLKKYLDDHGQEYEI